MSVIYVIQGAGNHRYLYAIEPQNAIDRGLPVSLNLPFIQSVVPFVDVSSCDGALCFNSFNGRIAICNPFTNRLKFLPPTQPPPPSAYIIFSNCGFGYDSRSADYKVIRFFKLMFCEASDSSGRQEFRNSVTKSELFSFKNNEWKDIPASHLGLMLCSLRGSVVVNGSCHWLASVGDTFCILAFNFGVETFSTFPLPSTYDRDSICHVVTTENGLLGVILSSRYGDSKCFELWECGDAMLWTKLYDDAILDNVKKPVNLDGSIMYLVRETDAGLHQLLAYDWGERKLSEFDIYENKYALKIAFCAPSSTPHLRKSKELGCYHDEVGWNKYWSRIEKKVEDKD